MEAVVEALLFMSGAEVPLGELAEALKMDKATTKAIVDSLRDKYAEEERGIEIAEINGCYEMRTPPRLFEYIREAYKGAGKQGLSQTLLETLAIIAYKQPITKNGIEEIRGVNADHAVNKLMERGVITELGRDEAPGRPILFGTTNEFLRVFGIKSLDELPEPPEE